MKPENLQYVNIKEILDTITNVDRPDIREDFARESRGVRISTPGKVLERDFGTIHRFMHYPIRPNAYKNITGATNATPIVITSNGHGFIDNDIIFISEVEGNTAANGRWQITWIDVNTFSLDGSRGNGAYTDKGICSKNPIEIIRNETIYIKDELKSYHVLFGLDSSDNLHIYIGDEDNQTWLELTEVYYGTIKTVSTDTITIESVKDFLGNTADTDIVISGYFDNWISCLETGGGATAAQITSSALSGSDQVLTYEIYPGSAYGYSVGQILYLYRCTGILPDEQLGTDRGYEFSQGATPHIRFLEQDAQQKSMVIIGDSSTAINVKHPLNLRKGAYLGPGAFTIGGADTGWYETGLHTFTGWLQYLMGGVFPRYADIESVVLNVTLIEVKITGHPYATNDYVTIEQVEGITEANGTWQITKIDADWFSLNGSVGSGVYVGSTGRSVHIYFSDDVNLFRSDDNGETLINIGDHYYTRPEFVTYKIGWRNDYSNAKELYQTTDQGRNWTLKHTFGSDIKAMIACALDKIGLISGWTFYRHDGTTLDTYGALPNTLASPFGEKLFFYDSNYGWYVVYDAATYDTYIWRSTDGGLNWTRYTLAAGSAIRAFWFISSTVGFAGGYDEKLYKTSDGGQTWTYVSPARGPISSIVAFDANKVRIAAGGKIYYTADAGSSWIEEPHESTLPLDSLYNIRHFSLYGSSGFSVLDADNAAAKCTDSMQRLEGDAGQQASGYESGWYIDKYGLLPDCVTFGGILNPLVSATTTEYEVGEGIKIKIVTSEETITGDKRYYIRGYITALYTDYTGSGALQESDPIAQYFLDCSAKNQFPTPTITIYLKPGIINKSLYGFRFYQAWHDGEVSSWQLWADDASEYIHIKDMLLSSIGWEWAETEAYCLSNEDDKFTYDDVDDIMGEAISNIYDNINHAIDKNREYLTPKYAIKGSRSQGSVIVATEGDDTLRFSSIDGDVVHEDENFPNVSIDNVGNTQRLSLRGTGQILGLAILKGRVVVMRESEAEIYNPQNNTIDIIPIDFYAKESLIAIGKENPSGITWAGRAGIYMMPSDGSQIRQINRHTSNLFDGTLMLSDNTTPFVTDAYRQATKAGYDLLYHEIWMQFKLNKEGGGTEYLCQRFNLNHSKSSFRELNIVDSEVINFTRKRDEESFVITTKYGILKYPNRDTTTYSHPYEEEVRYGGYSSARGIPTQIKMNIAKVFRPNMHPELYDILIYFRGSGDAASVFNVNMFKNEDASAFDAQTYSLVGYPTRRMVAYHGNMSRLDLEVNLPAANLDLCKIFDISEIIIGLTMHDRVGNI